MSSTSRGNGKELRTQQLLQQEGWTVASRRHIGGGGDVLAVKPGERPRLIEVKATARSPWHAFPPADRKLLLEEADRAGAEPLLAWWAPKARFHTLIRAKDFPAAK